MKHTVGRALLRFGTGTLIALAVMAVVWRAGGPSLDLSRVEGQPLSPLAGHVVRVASKELGLSLAYALPLAVLLGVAMGRRPGSRLDRMLHGPLIALMGLPLYAITIGSLLWLVVSGPEWDLHIAGPSAATAVMLPWLARAIRDGVAEAAYPFSFGRTVVGSVGRILQQYGTLFLIMVVFSQDFVMAGGTLRYFQLPGLFIGDLSALFWALAMILLPTLLLHLIGDLLVAVAAPAPRPLARPSVAMLGLGSLMAASLVLMACLSFTNLESAPRESANLPPSAAHWMGTDRFGLDRTTLAAASTRGSLLYAAGAVAIAGLVGGSLWAVGQQASKGGLRILTPEVPILSLYAGVMGGLLGMILFSNLPWVLPVGIGIALAPQVAAGLPFGEVGAEGNRIGRRLAGLGPMLLAQALLAEMLLGGMRLFPVSGPRTLGRLSYETLVTGPGIGEPHRWTPLLLASIGTAGLYLIGSALLERGAAAPRVKASDNIEAQVA